MENMGCLSSTEITGSVNSSQELGQEFTHLPHTTSSEGSMTSSYADLFEASGVVIRDYLGSFSKDPLVVNRVTYNLNRCKDKVVIPYYRLLCLIAWRPFGKEYLRGQCCLRLLNFLYTVIMFGSLLFWYVIRVYTCQGYLVIDKTPLEPTETPATTIQPTIPANTTSFNWTDLIPSHRNAQAQNLTPGHPSVLDPCQHVFGTYIIPNFLHFMAFVIGFYHFRVAENEGLYSLMEKVYLQSTVPSKMTTRLRLYLLVGLIWFIYSMGTMIQYMFVFGFEKATGVSETSPVLMYLMMALIVVSGMMANCVNLAVVLSYCGQCKLLIYYIDGVTERIEEKSTELKTAMKDILVIKGHFNQLNGVLACSLSCIVFCMLITVLITAVLLSNFHTTPTPVWWYRVTVNAQWVFLIIFVVIQAANLTSRHQILLDKVLAIKVFGYQGHTEAEIDSFLNFIRLTKLEAEIFTIPVKTRYLFGLFIFTLQVLILIFQTGQLTHGSKWL